MTPKQIKDFKQLKTLKERAKFLLDIGVTTKITIKDLTPVCQAKVGDTALPVYGDTDDETIAAGVKWLEERLTCNE